ncbi:LuxR C-terminal-related transcriptional regulator [Microbacterium sp. NPDC089318]
MTDDRIGSSTIDAADPSEIAAAFVDAIRQGDTASAEAAARLGWFELVGRCAEPAAAALRRLDESSLRKSPLLGMLAGLCALETGVDAARGARWIDGAVTAAQDDGPGLSALDRALILAAESARLHRLGGVGQAEETARAAMVQARGVTTRMQSAPLADLFTQIGVALHYTGDVDLALEAFSAGQGIAPTTPKPADAAEVASLAAVFAYEGDIGLAARYLRHARAAVDVSSLTSVAAVNDWVAASMIELERFDGEGVLARLEAIDTRVPFEHQVALHTVTAIARMVCGDPAAALASLEAQMRSLELHTRRAVASSSLAPARSILQLSLGNVRMASGIVESEFAAGPTREVARARIELVRGHPGSALRRLAQLPTDRLPLRTAAEACAIEVGTLLRLDRTDRTDAAVDYLGALLARTGLRMPLAFLPETDFDRVMSALRAAGHGELFEGMRARSVLPEAVSTQELTARERTVLSALMENGAAAEIARDLYVSPNTVKSQLRSIYRKLGAANRQEAILIAVERQLLEPQTEADHEVERSH